jgi:hypothetical protein
MKRTVRVKHSSLLVSAAAGVFLAAAALSVAQTLQGQPTPASPNPQAARPGGRPMRSFPAPTNLKVLPKDTSGREVRDIMQKWAGSLGVHCSACHTADPKNLGPNGRPRLNFADDSKTDKQIARIMYTMTEQMNKDYISKAMDLDKDDMGSPVTCGTCHRGHKMPPDFVIPREERSGQGEGEGEPAGGMAAPAPGGAPLATH